MSAGFGISGRVAGAFLQSQITPLLALLGLLLGLFAVGVTPREEEPQINVTFANVFVAFPGATAREVEQIITTPAEQVMSEIEGVKHVYSVSRPGMAVLTVQYEVGEDRTAAILRLYNAVFSNQDWLPRNLGVAQPLVKPKGIDDVPILSLTLWSEDAAKGAHELQQVAYALEAELKRVPGTRDIYTVGGVERAVRVLLDPQKMAAYGVDPLTLRTALQAGNVSLPAGALVAGNRELLVQAGEFLASVEEVAGLVVGMRQGAPVRLEDVAEVSYGPVEPRQYVSFGTGPGSGRKGILAAGQQPAVTLAVAKKPGTNAVDIARQVLSRVEQMRGIVIPEGVQLTVTRNYGETADSKARTLIGKLAFATASVILLVYFTMGLREAMVVGAAVIITLAMTLFASWAWGFTLNRVSLFALIFSIGILVDDAIVVVENIHRHLQLGARRMAELIPQAVDEVGGPTILATFTVIAALLPMAFVSGLMGPYMSPIPINASLGMVISLAVAFVITPWMSLKLLHGEVHAHTTAGGSDVLDRWLEQAFRRWMTPMLAGGEGRRRRRQLWLAVGGMIAVVLLLPLAKVVVLKMLPFDNKSEFQVVVDLPEGTALEQTARVLDELAAEIGRTAEVSDYQTYAGTAAPINFNGLVRQYYLREAAHLGDIQVNLVDKSARERKSHEVAAALRPALQKIGERHGATVKVVEVPPGPPVLSPLVAEIYGLDYVGQRQAAAQVRDQFQITPDIVDVDDTVEDVAPRDIVAIDQRRAARFGFTAQQIASVLAMALGGEDATFLHGADVKYPVPVRLELPASGKARLDSLLDMKLATATGQRVAVRDVTRVREGLREYAIHHKDLLPVVYVMGDMTGRLDSPLYGLFGISAGLDEAAPGIEQFFFRAPVNPYQYSLKWDGEWQVTFETFRDMGLAYAVGLVLIYFLVVAQFKSYLTPLIIMAPIPLTLIGVLPGHALTGKHFTATSMIGMIALAGIIVRNSILLVDFINEQIRSGVAFEEAVVRSGIVRTKPIVLTGLAAMIGALFILDDPIFSGLAVSLIFGILVSTLLTLVVIPVLYYAAMSRRFAATAGA
jgi:multidrug efflux pump subunit AcrB